MDTQPQNPNQMNQPSQPAQTTPPAPPVTPAMPPKPAPPLPKDQGKSNQRLVVGCVGAFGCSLLLFLGVLFAFLAFGSPENPIFGFFGVAPGEVVNVLITLVNLIFLVLVFVSFIFAVIGIFRITTARKDDRVARRKGTTFTFGAFAVMVMLIFIWVFAYFFLAQKRTVSPRVAIATEPTKTTNLSAPISIKFDASKAPINRRQFDILNYRWNFGDGTTLTGNPQTHTFTELGNFKVVLTINLKEKASGKEENVEFSRDVTVSNVLANVVIKTDKTKGEAPLTVNFDGSASSSVNGEIIAYAWDLNGDGQFNDASEAKTTATFDKVGTYLVKLRVTDSTGAFAINETEIEVVPADMPVAVMAVEGVTGAELETGRSYIFSAANSTTPRGSIEKYQWDFGDGTKAVATRTASHTFSTQGEYEVTLTVVDSNGKKGEIVQRFMVKAKATAPLPALNTNPEAVNGVVSGQAPFTVIFDASASQDPNQDIVDYQWDFNGDGTTDDANAVTSYTFAASGTYNVLLTLTDAANLSAKTQVVVNVEPAGLAAELTANPTAGTVPLTVEFDASGSAYPEGKIVNFEWDFGDGTPMRIDVAKLSYQYTQVGTFTARVTAMSADNKRASAQVIINVRPVPLQACFESTVSKGKSPLTVQFDPTCSTGNVVKYQWDFAKLGESDERKPSFTFQNPGQYGVILKVTDSQNVVDTYTKTITVTSPL